MGLTTPVSGSYTCTLGSCALPSQIAVDTVISGADNSLAPMVKLPEASPVNAPLPVTITFAVPAWTLSLYEVIP